MKFFTSRYTAALEEQVKEQKEEILRLRQQNNELAALILKQGTAEVAQKPKAVEKDKPEPPRSVNWLRTRPLLETPNLDVREAPPEKEKTANGTR